KPICTFSTTIRLPDSFLTHTTNHICSLTNFISPLVVPQTFYEDPRYILFIHMVINDAIQLTVTITLFVLSYIFYKINVSFCCFFILVAVFTTRNTPVNLASMAIERYIAICEPLRHSQICTVRKTHMVIGLIWFICMAPDITDLFVTLATESLSFFHESVFCLRQNVFKDPILAYKRQAFDIIYFSCVCLILIFTYFRIMFVARAISTEKRSAHRARNTILLHGVQLAMCLLSYISPSVELVLHLIFPGRILEIRFANYLIVYILPRFLSPMIYGVRDKKFRKRDIFICALTHTIKGGKKVVLSIWSERKI
uniref:Odorant receptor, family 90, subfamily A, member 1 n=1 Tax=Scophthalmus maximus TaxID=52904 RepID=A0A8D2ZUA4_SCOMX